MHVRRDTDRFDSDGQGLAFRSCFVMTFAGGDVEFARSYGDATDNLLGGLIGKVNADPRLIDFLFAVGMVMNLQYEFTSFAQHLAGIWRQSPWHGARCPRA